MLQDMISIIVPVYNVEQYLERCINTLVNQTYSNLEIILVDDGSTDGSSKLCDRLKESDTRISVIHKENGGLSSARNAGLEKAQGKYVAFVDSDDWVSLDTYEYLHDLVKVNNAEIADIGCLQVYEPSEKAPKIDEKIEVLNGEDILVHYMYRGLSEQKGAPYSSCRKLYLKELFTEKKPFVEGTVNEDICFNFNILKKCNTVVVSNQVKYFYFQNPISITSGKLKSKDLALLSISKELLDLAEGTHNKKVIELAEMKLARSDFSILARAARYGIDSDMEDSETLVKNLVIRLRKNIVLLWRSPMPFNRKILATLFAVNFKFCKSILCR